MYVAGVHLKPPPKVVGMSWIECPGGAYNLKQSASKVSKAQLEFDIQCVGCGIFIHSFNSPR